MSIRSDVRHALTALRRSPGFTLIAVVTLGIGIGANTSAFSILNEVLLRPLPYPDGDRLQRIYRATAQNPRAAVSGADYLDLKSEMSRYGEIAAYAYTDMSLSAPGERAEMSRALRVSDNLFAVLRIEPRLGRTFRPDEAVLGNHRVLIISSRFWRDRFASDPRIIGRTVRVDGEVHDIVGVLPDTMNDWRHLGPVDLYRPLGFSQKEGTDRSATWLRIIGRPSDGLSMEQAEAFLENFGRKLVTDHPVVHAGTTWRTLPVNRAVIPPNAPGILFLLVGLSAFVLLIACSNLANLLLTRTMARAREFAVRSALGASRTALLQPLLLESLLLAIAGGVGAIFVARWTTTWLAANTDSDGPGLLVRLDWHVLSFAFVACLVTALAFAAAPALFILRLDPDRTLRSGSRGNTGDRWQQRFHHGLIIGQFALAMVLLAGAALFVRGYDDLNRRDLGWNASQVVNGTLLLPSGKYSTNEAIETFQRLALQRLEQLPGVASATMAYAMPFLALGGARKYIVEGREAPKPGFEPAAAVNGVSPRYFETVGTRVLSGRAFSEHDTYTSAKVYVINQAMARGLFADANPIGRRIAQAGGETVEWGEIIGVVGDVETVNPDPSPITYQVYQPIAQEPRLFGEIGVRVDGSAPSALIESIRSSLAALDADLSLRNLEPAEATIARANTQLGIIGSMFSMLAVLGLGLAVLGIYGVITRTTAQRTSEFGIRLALGALASDITRLVLTSGAKLALTGSGIGLLGAFGISRALAALFPSLHTNSIPVMSGVTVLLISSALIACYIPARHASRSSPADTLRP